MRQRKAKDLDNRLAQCSEYMIKLSEDEKHRAVSNVSRKYFDDGKELFLEIGCGKGNFIIKKAGDNPDKNFIAVEGQETVLLRAVEKVKALDEKDCADFNGIGFLNLKFMSAFIDRMSDFFEEGQLSGIYLNFSDPWPKERHKKRRLTYRKRLEDYAWALKKGGFIEIKTDNDALYEFTLEEIETVGLDIVEQTDDLHASEFDSKYTMTEYEEKFSAKGKNINYVKAVVR